MSFHAPHFLLNDKQENIVLSTAVAASDRDNLFEKLVYIGSKDFLWDIYTLHHPLSRCSQIVNSAEHDQTVEACRR